VTFIVFEGPEGAGKTTQLELARSALTALGHEVLATREPGGTPIGEAIRNLLLDQPAAPCRETEAYLVTAARAEHVQRVILPALASGAIVLCDRFVGSTLAYQGAGRGLRVEQLMELQTLAVGSLVPDLTILLDLPAGAGLARKPGSAERNRIDREDLAFHERVIDCFREMAKGNPRDWRTINADRKPEVVHDDVMLLIHEHLARRRDGREVATQTGRRP
jgi:dTMP kinase